MAVLTSVVAIKQKSTRPIGLHVGISQQTQNICITFVQCRPNVEDVEPTLSKCYENVLFLRDLTQSRLKLGLQTETRGSGPYRSNLHVGSVRVQKGF